MLDFITGFGIFGDMFADFNFVLKLFVLITIISWVRNHFGNSTIGWAIVMGVSYFVLFANWALFGGAFLIYLLLTMGVTGIIIDYLFLTQSQGAPSQGKPDMTGQEEMDRAHKMHRARPPPLMPGPPV